MTDRPIIIVGLGYGDEGKGSVVSSLVEHCGCKTVVRFNGGAQCSHNVVTDDGRHHAFAQFGSGTFTPGVRTFLSRFMLLNPGALLNEEAHLRETGIVDGFDRLAVDGRAVVTTPYHQLVNRLLEQERGTARHGSCGMGIGETVRDSIERPDTVMRAWMLRDEPRLWRVLNETRLALSARYERFREALQIVDQNAVTDRFYNCGCKMHICKPRESVDILNGDGLLFEGGQGILLDEDYGFHPHTTWSRTTMANAMTLLRESGNETKPFRIGVTRTFMTRHGPGPFPTEDESFRAAVAEDHNATGEYQGPFRVGKLDVPLLTYAIAVNGGLDAAAVTYIDKWPKGAHELTEDVFPGIKLCLTSHGQRTCDKTFHFLP